jgi:hypothetical protein
MSQNPLEAYRRVQRALRHEFEPFTRQFCPTCPTPCCRRPARIAPTDILLAGAVGWKARVRAAAGVDGVQEAATRIFSALTEGVSDSDEYTLCEHLGEKGCTFPPDLRPFGCTAYICPIMYREWDRKALARIRRLVRELERRHQELMAYLHRRHPDDR